MALRLVLIAIVATLSGCAHVETRATTPVPVPLAREMRAGSQDGTVARVFVLVAGEHRSQRQDGPRLESGGHALVAVREGSAAADAERWTWLESGEALVVDAAPGLIAVRTLPSSLADASRNGRQMTLNVAAGEAAFVAVAAAPSPDPSAAPIEITRVNDEVGRAMLLSQALVRTRTDDAGLMRADAPRAVIDSDAADAVRTGRMADGLGRLLVLPGGYIDERQGANAIDRAYAGTTPTVRARTLSLLIEGQPIASFLRDEILAIDLPPGTYAMLWQVPPLLVLGRPTMPSAWNEVPRAVRIAAGAATILSADIIDLSRRRAPDAAIVVQLAGAALSHEGRWVEHIYTFLRPAQLPSGLDGAARIVVPTPASLALLPGARLPGN